MTIPYIFNHISICDKLYASFFLCICDLFRWYQLLEVDQGFGFYVL